MSSALKGSIPASTADNAIQDWAKRISTHSRGRCTLPGGDGWIEPPQVNTSVWLAHLPSERETRPNCNPAARSVLPTQQTSEVWEFQTEISVLVDGKSEPYQLPGFPSPTTPRPTTYTSPSAIAFAGEGQSAGSSARTGTSASEAQANSRPRHFELDSGPLLRWDNRIMPTANLMRSANRFDRTLRDSTGILEASYREAEEAYSRHKSDYDLASNSLGRASVNASTVQSTSASSSQSKKQKDKQKKDRRKLRKKADKAEKEAAGAEAQLISTGTELLYARQNLQTINSLDATFSNELQKDYERVVHWTNAQLEREEVELDELSEKLAQYRPIVGEVLYDWRRSLRHLTRSKCLQGESAYHRSLFRRALRTHTFKTTNINANANTNQIANTDIAIVVNPYTATSCTTAALTEEEAGVRHREARAADESMLESKACKLVAKKGKAGITRCIGSLFGSETLFPMNHQDWEDFLSEASERGAEGSVVHTHKSDRTELRKTKNRILFYDSVLRDLSTKESYRSGSKEEQRLMAQGLTRALIPRYQSYDVSANNWETEEHNEAQRFCDDIYEIEPEARRPDFDLEASHRAEEIWAQELSEAMKRRWNGPQAAAYQSSGTSVFKREWTTDELTDRLNRLNMELSSEHGGGVASAGLAAVEEEAETGASPD